MEKNWLIINGWKIVIEGPVQIESTSPFSDKTYVFFAGSKLSTRGESSYPFQVAFSPEDLSKVGYPHLAQNTSVRNLRIQNVELYSNGVQRFKGILILTSIRPNLNTGYVKAEGLLFDPISDFVNQINNKNVNELPMGGVRVIDDSTNYTAPGIPIGQSGAPIPTIPTPRVPVINSPNRNSGYEITSPAYLGTANAQFQIICVTATSGSPADLLGFNTADYAAMIALNGDPDGMICFPTIFVPDEQNGDTWLNFWDPTGNDYFPCVAGMTDNSTGVDIYAVNVYQDLGNHIVPMYYYHQVIRHCFADLGYKLIDDSGFLIDEHFKRLVLINNFDILNAMTVTLSNQDGSKERTAGYRQLTTVINPKNHLPADTIQTFLLDFMVKFNCFFEFGDNGTVSLRKGDFLKADRELTAYGPEPLFEDTLDTGITLAYDFPSDKQYDNVKKVQDMTPYNSTEKVFISGFNKTYPIPLGDTIPNPLPIDDYYAALYEDCNQLALILDGTPAWDSIPGISTAVFPYFFYPYDFIVDNILPVTMGVDTRPDSPSVNLKEANQANTESYTLKYPPISHINNNGNNWAKQTPYYLQRMQIVAKSTDYIIPTGSYLSGASQTWSNGANISMNIGAGLVINPGQNVLVTPVFDTTKYNGYFYVQGTVVWYNNESGEVNFNVTYMMPDWYTIDPLVPPGTFNDYAIGPYPSDNYFYANGLATSWWSWADWDVTISPYQNTPQVSITGHTIPVHVNPNPNGIPDSIGVPDKIIVNPDGGNIPLVSAPIMNTPVLAYPTQDYQITPKLAYAYTTGLFTHVWGFQPLIATSGGWVSDVPSGVGIPGAWETRSEAAIIETGFYWGLQRAFTRVFGSYTSDINTSILSAAHTDSPAMFKLSDGTPYATIIPTLTGYERIYANPFIAPGWFNLSLHGPYSIPAQFWKGFINQYLYNRKVTITVYESMTETMQHKFWNAVLWRGAKLYVSQIRTEVPYIGKGVEYLCYFI